MSNHMSASKRDLAVATIGMSLYWPFFTHPVCPPELLALAEGMSSFSFMVLLLAALAASSLGVGLSDRFLPAGILARFLRPVPPVAAGILIALGILAATTTGPLSRFACWACPVVLGVFVSLATARWALVVSSFAPGPLALVLTLSLSFSTVLSIVAYDLGARWGLSEAASTQLLPLASGLAGYCAATPAMYCATAPAMRPLPSDARATPATSAAPALFDGNAGDSRSTRQPARAGARWLVMMAALLVYLLGSGVFRNAFTAHTGRIGVDQDWPHRALLLGLSIMLVIWAWAANRKGRAEKYPWVAFLIVCLAALYCSVVLYPLFSSLANEVMLPTRPVAIFLAWVAAVYFARQARVSPIIATACVFLPMETAIRVATTWPGEDFWTGELSQFALATIMLATALALTLGVIAWLWLSARDQRHIYSCESGAAFDAELLGQLKERNDLSERETEVMALLARGYTQKRIAEELMLSVSTVQTYSKTLYRKLGVHSRQEIIDLVAQTARA